MRSEILILLAGVAVGYSARAIIPTKSDKAIKRSSYVIACLDGQISIMEMITKHAKFKACSELADEEGK